MGVEGSGGGGQEQVQDYWVDFWNRRGKRRVWIVDNVFYRTVSSDPAVLDRARSMPRVLIAEYNTSDFMSHSHVP